MQPFFELLLPTCCAPRFLDVGVGNWRVDWPSIGSCQPLVRISSPSSIVRVFVSMGTRTPPMRTVLPCSNCIVAVGVDAYVTFTFARASPPHAANTRHGNACLDTRVTPSTTPLSPSRLMLHLETVVQAAPDDGAAFPKITFPANGATSSPVSRARAAL